MHHVAILVHYRHAELTARCLSSLIEHCPQLGIYVVDNSPGDGSLETLQRRFAGQDIEWLPQRDNLGFGGGCNAGIATALAAGAEAVMLINNDAWVESDVATAFDDASRRYRDKALLTGCIYEPDGRIWYAGGDYSLYTVRTRHRHSPPDREYRVPFASGCLLWLTRPVLAELKGFDPDYFLYLEDLDLSLRASCAGLPIVCLPQVRIRHQASATTGGARHPLSVYYQNRNRWRLLRAHGRLRHWPIFVPFYLLGLLRRLTGPGRGASLRALRDAFRGQWGQGQP